MQIDRRFIWVLIIVLLIIVLWWALDHVLYPTLPMPGGGPPIAR